jgi:hypothetical protein
MFSAKDVFKLPNQNVEVLIIANIVVIQRQSWGFQARGWGEIVRVSNWLMYLNILKVVYWGVKEKRCFCLSRLQYLLFSHHQGSIQCHLNCWTLGIMFQLTQLLFTSKCVHVNNRIFSDFLFFIFDQYEHAFLCSRYILFKHAPHYYIFPKGSFLDLIGIYMSRVL